MNTDVESTPTLSEAAPVFYMGDLDNETYEILVDDKIATGG